MSSDNWNLSRVSTALAFTPYIVLALAAAWLGLNWDALPARWITHWGIHGPDGWATRTPSGVFGVLGLGAATCLLLEGVGWVTRATRSDSVPTEVADATRLALRIVTLSVAMSFASIAITLPFQPRLSVLGVLVSVVGGILGAGLVLSRGLSAGRAARPDDTRLAGYRGLYYSNADDPRVWVPKLMGLGWTLNFAHRVAWVWLAVLLAPSLVIVLLFALR